MNMQMPIHHQSQLSSISQPNTMNNNNNPNNHNIHYHHQPSMSAILPAFNNNNSNHSNNNNINLMQPQMMNMNNSSGLILPNSSNNSSVNMGLNQYGPYMMHTPPPGMVGDEVDEGITHGNEISVQSNRRSPLVSDRSVHIIAGCVCFVAAAYLLSKYLDSRQSMSGSVSSVIRIFSWPAPPPPRNSSWK